MWHHIMGFDRAWPYLLAAWAIGYLIGSVPFGLIVTRAFGLGDVRSIGSGNIGATNVLRTGNKWAAALTLNLDMAKGALPVLVFLGLWGDLAAQMAGLGAFLGHCFPVWLRFAGGKGVATFLGIVLALWWPVGLMTLATWVVAAVLTRISSVGALAAAALAPVWLITQGRWEAVLVTSVLAALVWLFHRGNIARLIAGTEPRIGRRGTARG